MKHRLPLLFAVLALLVVPALAVSALPSPFKVGAVYTGKTARGDTCRVGASDKAPCTMTMRPGRDGKTLVITLRTSEECADERVYRYDFTARFPRKAGTIKPDGRYSLFSDVDVDLGEGNTAKSRVLFDGRFYRTRSGRYLTTGALRGTSTITFSDGQTLKCASGKTPYTLRAPRSG